MLQSRDVLERTELGGEQLGAEHYPSPAFKTTH